MITLAMMICGCCMRFDCEPTGRILFTSMPHSIDEIGQSVDGAMGGISCAFRIDGDRR